MLLTVPLIALAFVPSQQPEAPTVASPVEDGTSWGRFRGPNGTGNAGGALPDALDSQSSVLWRLDVPSGYSSPIVTGGRVFLTGADETHLMTLCVDEESGELLWRRKVQYDGKRPGANSPAAPTPATDGERVYALFHHAGLIAYDLYGEELWRNELDAPFNIPHGLATSPVVHDGAVIVQMDQDTSSSIVCLDAATGEERWRTSRDAAVHSYSTPAVHAPDGGDAIVIVSGSYEIAAYSIATGERVWWVTGAGYQTKAVPIVHGDMCLVCAYMPLSGEFGLPRLPGSFPDALAEHDADDSGTISRDEWDHDMMQRTWFIWDRNGDDVLDEVDYAYLMTTQTAKGALFAIQLGGEGDVTESHVRWSFDDRRKLSDAITPIVVGDALFLLRDGGMVASLDVATGEVIEDGRVGEPDQYYASPVAAGGRILFTGMSGQLTVVEAGAEWETVTSVSLEDAGQVWSTPALSEGRILVRGTEGLFCLKR